MKIRYKFVTGETTEVEAPDAVMEAVVESRKSEHAANERMRTHLAFYIGSIGEENLNMLKSERDPLSDIIQGEDRTALTEALEGALSQLTEVQFRRLLKLAGGKTIAEIAREEGVSHNCVKESILGAQKKIKKFLVTTLNLDHFFC